MARVDVLSRQRRAVLLVGATLLLVGATLLLVGCVRSASAVVDGGDPAERVAIDPTPAPPAPGSGRLLDLTVVPDETNELSGSTARLVWTHHDQGSPVGFETILAADLHLTELQPVDDDAADAGDSVVYRVTGSLEHIGARTSCTSPVGNCRVVRLEDADLVGFAVRHDDSVTFELDWRSFGGEAIRSSPRARVAVGVAELDYLEVAVGLERAGVVGRPMAVSVASGRMELGRPAGSISSTGTLTVNLD